MSERLANALNYLLSLIQQGWEYPDAEWKAASTHTVSSDALRDAYDTYTATGLMPE